MTLLHPKPDLFTFFNAIAGLYDGEPAIRDRIIGPFSTCIEQHGGTTDRLIALQ